ncbi:hydroxymethylglutaryl-CoA lyase [Nocardioides sp. NPDC059952]|uniref:hydroxymethylglutaryl-CoA lyase n=1 Tax=Nocardioides sp. NPDC059952 TaxID=3347014 RepID=UPI003669EA66
MTGAEIEIVEVSPRDGLQNEAVTLDTRHKIALVEQTVAAGARRVEVTSFVRPDRVPQMADAEAVLAGITRVPGVSYAGLVLNRRGTERAVDAGVDELNYVVPATDVFGRRNQGVTVAEAVRALEGVAAVADTARLPLTVTVAVAFGCPYQGEVSTEEVAAVVRDVLRVGPLAEVALADTIGAGVPAEVHDRFAAVRVLTDLPLRAHFHDTRKTGLANALAAVAEGVRTLDSSAAGLGGCPFAPGAAGNVATEDLAWLLERSGLTTGLDIAAIAAAGAEVCGHLGTRVRSGVGSAGPFPVPSDQP